MIVKCPHCQTVAGRECTNTFRGPRAKPRWQSVCGSHHVAAIGQCDVCHVTAPTIRKNYVVEWDSAEVPGWETLKTGRMLRALADEEIAKSKTRYPSLYEGERGAKREAEERARLKPHEVHACPECVAALRTAQQVAFDVCLSQREGLNAGRKAA